MNISSVSRMHTMDMLRGAAVLLVIFWHIFAIPQTYGTSMPQSVLWVFNILAPIRIPLLFFLSGMLLPRSLEKPVGEYIGGKIRNILWPFVLWMVITCAVATDLSSLTNPWYWLGGAYHLWYLIVLFWLFCIGFLARWVPVSFLLVLMGVTLIFGNIDTPAIKRVFFYSLIFFSGSIFYRYREKFYSSGVWVPAILGVLSISMALLTGVTAHNGSNVLFYLFGIPMLLLFLWVMAKTPRIPMLERVGQRSIVWYLVHFPVIVLTYRLSTALELSYWTMISLCALTGLGVSYLFYRYYSYLSFLFSFPRVGQKA